MVAGFEVLDPRLGRLPSRSFAGRRVASVERIGKQVAIELEAPASSTSARHARRPPLWLGVHLRMTGRLIWLPERGAPEPDHVRARMTLERGKLVFADLRRFGTIAVGKHRSALEPAGLDPMSEGFRWRRLAQLMQRSGQPIKVWLLRQDRLVGLGNIYVCEILFAAGIDPRRPAGQLRAEEVKRLHAVTRRVLRRAIDNCGTTFSDFQDAHGVTGSYQRYLRVYGRDGLACHRCGDPVRRIVQQQRSSFFCARCQPRRGR